MPHVSLDIPGLTGNLDPRGISYAKDRMNVHVLLLECPNCGRPIPLTRIDEAVTYPAENQQMESWAVQCSGVDCCWRGAIVAALSKYQLTEYWPYVKSVGTYTKRTYPNQP